MRFGAEPSGFHVEAAAVDNLSMQICSPPRVFPRACGPAICATLLIVMLPAFAATAPVASKAVPAAAKPAAVLPENPYEAVVPVDDESNASRDKALRLALIEVLKRVVGRSDAATSSVLARASSLVQQYAFQRDEATSALSFRAVFDQSSVEDAIKAEGLPVFGVDPGVVEAWIVQVRGLRSADDYARVLEHFGRIRGVRKVEVAEISEQGLRLRMIVEGGTDRAIQLAEAGGLLRGDGTTGIYVFAGR